VPENALVLPQNTTSTVQVGRQNQRETVRAERNGGGYAALVGMTRSTDLFACGIDIVGISNLITWMNNLPEYWKPMLPVVKVRVGDIDTEEGRAFLVERCEAATDWVGGERVNLQDPAFRPDITFVA
jgi:hypothetical protein